MVVLFGDDSSKLGFRVVAEDGDAVVVGVDGGIEVALGVLVKLVLKGHAVGGADNQGVAVAIIAHLRGVVGPDSVSHPLVAVDPQGVLHRCGGNALSDGGRLIVDDTADIVGHLAQEAFVQTLGG